MLFHAHSGVRYLVLLSAFAVAIPAGIGLSTGKPSAKTMRILSAIFVGLLDVQFLLGLALLLTGYYTPKALGHVFVMVLVVALAHVSHVFGKKKPGGAYRWPLIGAVGSLALILAGLAAIGRGLV